MSEMLEKARKYEDEQGKQIKAEDRPAFHVSPYVGWMNDPNGFSYYQGEYHLFYQYYPYDTHWNSMHWGHVVSKDLLHTILRHIHNSGHSIEEPLDVVIPVRVSIRVVSNGVVKPVRDRTLAHALMLQNGILAQFNDSAMHVLTPSLQYPYPSQKTAPSDNQDRF